MRLGGAVGGGGRGGRARGGGGGGGVWGPLEFKRQSQLRYWLAPVRLARVHLVDAQRLARGRGFGEALEELGQASQSCTLPAEGSFEAFQARYVDTCVFRILMKNAPARAKDWVGRGGRGSELAVVAAETEMKAAGGSLVAALEDLRLALEGARAGSPGAEQGLDGAFRAALADCDAFELSVQSVLGEPAPSLAP